MLIEENFDLSRDNTFGLSVYSAHKADIRSVEDLREIHTINKYRSIKKFVLGGGSNVLFTRNYLGLILKMQVPGIDVIEEHTDTVLVAFGAGENWHQSVLYTIEQGFGGIENLSLIPGTMGAAPIQNIGAYGVELKDVFHSLEAYEVKTGKVVRFYREDCKFGYRYSVFKGALKGKYIITRVFLRLSKKPEFHIAYGNLREVLDEMGVEELSLQAVSDAVIQVRQSKLPDPAEIGNSGSFFKNPVIENDHYESLIAAFEEVPGYPVGEHSTKVPAAWLIEKCGWKGYREGNIGVHEKQPLVLVNYGGGYGKDIYALSEKIIQSVNEKFAIELEREVNVI